MKKILALALFALIGTADVSAMNFSKNAPVSKAEVAAADSQRFCGGLRTRMYNNRVKLMVGLAAVALVGTAVYAYSVGKKADDKASALAAMHQGFSVIGSGIQSGFTSAYASGHEFFTGAKAAAVETARLAVETARLAAEAATKATAETARLAAEALQTCKDAAGKLYDGYTNPMYRLTHSRDAHIAAANCK